MSLATRAQATIDAGLDLGNVEASGSDYAVQPRAAANLRAAGPGMGPGTVGRTTLIVWGAAAVWLFLVWRAVEGY